MGGKGGGATTHMGKEEGKKSSIQRLGQLLERAKQLIEGSPLEHKTELQLNSH